MTRTFHRTLTCLGIVLLATVSPAVAQLRTEFFQNKEVVAQEIIVRFRGATEAQRMAIASQDPDIVAASAAGRAGAMRLRSRGRGVAALLQAYGRRADVEFAEPNYIWRKAEVPNEPAFDQQWALQNTGQTVGGQTGSAGADIKAVEAWNLAEGSRRIVVGVIDTGVNYNHPDLVENIWTAPGAFSVNISGQTINCPAGSHGFNAITRTCDPMDDDNHGSFTAGIVGASGNNGLGISGVSRVASLMGLKFLDREGVGTTADAIAAIEFAVQIKNRFPADANIRVLNASWGGNTFSQALLNEINLAGNNNMLFVTSAGNNAHNLDSNPDYPASYNAPNIIAVASTDNRDQKAEVSSYGAAAVHLGAPGVDILSTSRHTEYILKSGTSASAAMVSGAAALLLSACQLNTTGLKTTILQAVDPIDSLVGITVTGGRLNVGRAVQDCVGTPPPPTFTFLATPAGRAIAFGNNSADFALSVNPLNGFSTPVTFQVFNMPPGMTASFSPAAITGGTTTMTVTADPNVPHGNYRLRLVAAGGGITRDSGVVVTVGIPLSCTIDLSPGSTSGALLTNAPISVHRPPAYAHYCSFTLPTTMRVEIRMSGSFDPYVFLLSSEGDLIASPDEAGPDLDAKILRELEAGTYIIEGTTLVPGDIGVFTMRINGIDPVLTSVTPEFGVQATVVGVTIVGDVFVGAPFEVVVESCPTLVVSNVSVLNPSTATATFTLPGTPESCRVFVRTPAGRSSERGFTVKLPPPTITSISPSSGMQGQRVTLTITGTDFGSFSNVYVGTPPTGSQINSVKPLNATTITLDWDIPVNFTPGTTSLYVQTSGGTSNTLPFTVGFAPPVITSLHPSIGGPGVPVTVRLNGTSFSEPFLINAGPDIAISDARLVTMDQIEATFTPSPGAALGDYAVTVTTAAGTSPQRTFKLISPPVITSITPQRAFLGRNTLVVLGGSNFVCAVHAAIDGTGVQPNNSGCTETSVTLNLIVAANAPVGPRMLTVSSTNGTSNPVTLDIVEVPPLISSILPQIGAQGTSVALTIAGTNLESGSVSVSGSGVQASTQASTPSTLTATVQIAADAPIGPRSLTVSNNRGVSDPVTFSVTPPTWPDLTILLTVPPELGGAFDETYRITVRNEGTNTTSAPITVNVTLTHDFQYRRTIGAGWTCAPVANPADRFVACTTSGNIPVSAESSFEMIVATAMINGSVSTAAEVISVEDYNPSNDKTTVFSLINSPDRPRWVLSTSAMPGQQAILGLVRSKTFPHDIVGTLNSVSFSFFSQNPGVPMDPAVQFATGGHQVNYIFRADSLQAEFQGVAGPIPFQTGTVAGFLTFSGTFQAGNGPTFPIQPETVQIHAVKPTITKLTTESKEGGLVAAITLFSSSREVQTISFQFNTPEPVQIRCGDTPGCVAFGQSVSFSVSSAFNGWYVNNTAYGTLATIRVPFTLSGVRGGNVSVTLANSHGTSNSMSFALP